MACNYADGLSPYDNKGKLGLKEIFDSELEVKRKTKLLAGWIQSAEHVVIHTGAGISTSAGIPDFRGPNGVWTLESKGIKPTINTSFDEAIPTYTHMAIVALVKSGLAHYVVTQNIDGLHLKSGLERKYLSELHGNMFAEECNTCSRRFVRKSATSSVGQKCLKTNCRKTEVIPGRPCRGKLHDTILDWEAGLPENDLDMAIYNSGMADLNICLGTTLQIVPSGNLPLKNKKNGQGKMVICNLQPTKHDKKADLVINTYVDSMMALLVDFLGITVDVYLSDNDPTKNGLIIDWTISDLAVNEVKTVHLKRVSKRKEHIKEEHGHAPVISEEILYSPKDPDAIVCADVDIKLETEEKAESISPKDSKSIKIETNDGPDPKQQCLSDIRV